MNRLASTAVMARRVEPADSLDFFPTPPWATRAFVHHVLGGKVFGQSACDPACGEGHMAVALAEYFETVHASDIHPYGFGQVADFLDEDWPAAAGFTGIDWIITNPPFNRAEEFVTKGLTIARRGVAILVRTAFLEGVRRWQKLFAPHPPAIVAQFVERCPMHRGRWEPDGKSATSYCWIVWQVLPSHEDRRGAPRLVWIPPSRKSLTRKDDAMRFNAAAPVPLLAGGEATIEDVAAELKGRLL